MCHFVKKMFQIVLKKFFFLAISFIFMRLHLYTSTLDMFVFANDSGQNCLFSMLSHNKRERIDYLCVCV